MQVSGPYAAGSEVASACCETIAQALGNSPGSNIAAVQADKCCVRWHAIASDTLLRSGGRPIIYAVEGQQAHMVAVFYPQDAVDEDAPEPPGIVDVGQWSRPDGWPTTSLLLESLKEMLAVFKKEHPAFLYIKYVCVRPEHQNRGLGSRLLRHAVDLADRRGVPCYLEATDDANVRLYARHGFVVLKAQEFAFSWTSQPARLFFMSRPAHAAAVSAVPPQ